MTAKREQEAAAERARELEQQQQTARHASLIWEAAGAITAEAPNPYLTRKGVQATENLRQIEVEAVVRIIGYHPTADERRHHANGCKAWCWWSRIGEMAS
ncbi:MAG: hypothetical protein MZV65_42800 [Chromatiales bacterium]|nr:hypothetical protein [Chromatiales bacterium]